MLKKCEVCSKEFQVKKSHFDSRFCCSKKCSNVRAKKIFFGSKNPNFKNSGEKFCNFCNKKYYSYNKKSKYCSHFCADTSNRKKIKPPRRSRSLGTKSPRRICSGCSSNNPKKGRTYCEDCREKRKNEKVIKIICEICGKSRESYSSKIRKYCSIDCTHKARKGSGNSNYKGGITKESKKIRNSPEYKIWRNSVFERDKYTCVFCGQVGGELNADHILPFSTHKELRLDINNGRTLCKPCHVKTDTYLCYKGKKKIKTPQQPDRFYQSGHIKRWCGRNSMERG